jgi:hypothetical protein
MALGLIPARGDWEQRLFPKSQVTTLSQGAYSKGDLVCLDHGRHVSVWTSTQSGYLGIALTASSESKFGTLVAIPKPGCTAYADSLTTDAVSNFSFGQAGSFMTRYGRTSVLTMQPAGGASAHSYIVTIASTSGVNSAESRIEVAFLSQNAAIYSASSGTFNN